MSDDTLRDEHAADRGVRPPPDSAAGEREPADDESVRLELPDGGVLYLERPLPYLLVHRAPPGPAGDVGARLIRGEASYLLWRGGDDAELHELVRGVARRGAARFGAFLVLEPWLAPPGATTFGIHLPEGRELATVAALERGLAELRELHPALDVALRPGDERQPPGAPPLLSIAECYEIGCLLLGLEVPPVFLQPEAPGRVYPVFFRRFKAGLSRALRQAVHTFIRVQTSAHIANFRMLAPRRVHDAVWDADRTLAEIERSFDFLLLTSPVDEAPAWQRFRDTGFQREPDFHYRLLPVDPELLKRRLYDVDMEPIEDPTLLFLLQEKRQELDRRISMLAERGSPAFLHSSIRVYRQVDAALLATALELLERLPPPDPRTEGPAVGAEAFAVRAEEEFGYYRERDAAFAPEIQIRPDVSGLMVSSGNLLVETGLALDPRRVEALVHHEIGTHVLTYANGGAQPLRQLATGLAGYDELQEALGVLAEYLAGGITPGRMRTLAARVVAAHAVEHGADFLELFRLLTEEHGFAPEAAYDVTVRAVQGGGFTRDVIYLRGIATLLDYLRAGGALEPLYVGKIALEHVPAIEELRDRGILVEPPLRPRILAEPAAARRLDALRRGLPLIELIGGSAR